MCDMSKTINTIDWAILLTAYKEYLIQINSIQLTVHCETGEWSFFKIDAGVPQGDGLNVNEFTLYLARALYKENVDISAITSCKNTIDHIKKTVCSELETQNLSVNDTKINKYEIRRNRNESWKEWILLSQDMDKDIS